MQVTSQSSGVERNGLTWFIRILASYQVCNELFSDERIFLVAYYYLENVQVDDVRLYWVNYGAAFYRKDAFTKEEDEAILQAVTDYGEYQWVSNYSRCDGES
jgi:hypothetical protein